MLSRAMDGGIEEQLNNSKLIAPLAVMALL